MKSEGSPLSWFNKRVNFNKLKHLKSMMKKDG